MAVLCKMSSRGANLVPKTSRSQRIDKVSAIGRKLADRYAERNRPREADTRSADPLDWLLAAERRELVRTALAQLPRREAEILLLKYTQEWSYHDIAAHLGISHSAVETRLHRARQRLREVLVAAGAVEIQP